MAKVLIVFVVCAAIAALVNAQAPVQPISTAIFRQETINILTERVSRLPPAQQEQGEQVKANAITQTDACPNTVLYFKCASFARSRALIAITALENAPAAGAVA